MRLESGSDSMSHEAERRPHWQVEGSTIIFCYFKIGTVFPHRTDEHSIWCPGEKMADRRNLNNSKFRPL